MNKSNIEVNKQWGAYIKLIKTLDVIHSKI